jgi:TPR repeat protein
MTTRLSRPAAWLFLGLASLSAIATVQADEPLRLVSSSFMEVDAQLKSAKGHPNEEWRLNGLKAYLGGHYLEAIERFERAASYADKHSQHYLSLMYWHGQGVPADPVRGYIWSDLAAERGNRRLLAIREKMWAALTPGQQEQVAARGPDFYARYGDDIAKPRAETEIRRFARGMTGSRTGFRSQNIDIVQGGPINGSFGNATPGMLAASAMVVGGSDEEQFYADKRTQMAEYWQTQDSELGSGSVEVGPLEPVRRAKPPGSNGMNG